MTDIVERLVEGVEHLLGFVPEVHGDVNVSTEGAAVLPDPVHRDQEMQAGQRPGMAVPDTHPGHFAPSGPNHPEGPWSPALGVGQWAAGGVISSPMNEALLERPFHSANLHESHLAVTPIQDGPDPIPVRVVSPDTGRESWTDGSVGQITVADAVQQLLPVNRKRTRLLIFNEGAAGVDVRIAFDRQTAVGDPVGNAGQGFLVKGGQGQPTEVYTSSDVYVVNAKTDAANAPQVSYLQEFGVTGPGSRTVTAPHKKGEKL